MARVLPLALLRLLVAAGCTPDADPDRRIADGGVLADGWSLRLDEPTASPSDVRLTADGDARVGRNGPNVTF
ncbi:MAG: hypothetical protein ACO3RU_13920 [Planctomycetota bacterium]